MATIIAPTDKTLMVCFTDGGTILSYSVVSARTKYDDFLVVLHNLTKDHAHVLPNLEVSKEAGEGLSLADGAWWYKIVVPVHGQSSGKQATSIASDQSLLSSDWQSLDYTSEYESLMSHLNKEIKAPNVRFEFQHQLQKNRDEGRQPATHRGPLMVGGPETSQPQPLSHRENQSSVRRAEPHERHTLSARTHVRSGAISSGETNPYNHKETEDVDGSAVGFLRSMTGDPDPSILTPRNFVMRRFALNTDDFERNLDPALDTNQK